MDGVGDKRGGDLGSLGQRVKGMEPATGLQLSLDMLCSSSSPELSHCRGQGEEKFRAHSSERVHAAGVVCEQAALPASALHIQE